MKSKIYKNQSIKTIQNIRKYKNIAYLSLIKKNFQINKKLKLFYKSDKLKLIKQKYKI